MDRAILLSVLVALAGCLGGVGPPASDGPPEVAWTNGNGLNTTTLASTHFESLRAAGSFTVNHSETVLVEGEARPEAPQPDGYHPPSYTRQQVALDDGRYHDTFVTVGHRRSDHVVTPNVRASRQKECPDCAVEYRYQERPDGDTRSDRLDRFRTEAAEGRLAAFLRGATVGFNYSYAGTVEHGGERLHRYQAEQVLDTAPPPFSDPPTGTATILVTDGGVIREVSLEYTGQANVTVDGETRTVSVTHRFVRTYTAVGQTTVDRPDWVDRAAAADQPRATATGE